MDDYNARIYDPALGRFLSTDPLIAHTGSTQSINPYSYVENNPLNKVDPTGEVANDAGGIPLCGSDPGCVSAKSVTIEGVGSIGGDNSGHDSQNSGSTQKQNTSGAGQGESMKADNTGENDPNKHTTLGPSKKEMKSLKNREGWRNHPYNPMNKNGVPNTIGYGHTFSKKDAQIYEFIKHAVNSLPGLQKLGTAVANAAFTITKSQGMIRLKKDAMHDNNWLVKVFGMKTLRGLPQNRYDMLFDLNFNGHIHRNWILVKDVKAGNWKDAARQFLNIDHHNGKLVRGLANRRAWEAGIFLKGWRG